MLATLTMGHGQAIYGHDTNLFPFHNWAFQEGLLHAENIGGDIELMLGKRCLIGAFPWRYEGLEGCPCRIVAFLDAGDASVEAVGNAAQAILGTNPVTSG